MNDAYHKKIRLEAKDREDSEGESGSHGGGTEIPGADLQDERNGLLKSGGNEGAGANEIAECDSELRRREDELRQLHDRLLRNQADFENYKKRMAREKASLLKFGNESLMREILPVIDNLERFLEHAGTAKTIERMIEGIEIIRKELLRKLETFGLTMIAAQGKQFDPDKHESVAQVETPDHPEDTVVKELQKGYFIYERLLRPAKVIVAKASTPHPPETDL